MNQVIENIKGKLVEDLKKIFKDKLDKIIIYGSYARGNEDNESDIDVMVLTKEPDELTKQYDDEINKLSFELDMKYDIVISIIIKNSAHFYNWIDHLPFYTNVLKEGVVLYG